VPSLIHGFPSIVAMQSAQVLSPAPLAGHGSPRAHVVLRSGPDVPVDTSRVAMVSQCNPSALSASSSVRQSCMSSSLGAATCLSVCVSPVPVVPGRVSSPPLSPNAVAVNSFLLALTTGVGSTGARRPAPVVVSTRVSSVGPSQSIPFCYPWR
jgi:hypothetical protein